MLSGRASDPPVLIGTAIVDQHAATLGALGVVAALLRRERTGLGCKVDSNLLSAGLDLQIEPVNYHLNSAKLYDRSASGISSRFHQAPYGVFQTSDGWLTLSLADGHTLAKAFEDLKFLEWTKEDQFGQREAVNNLVASHMVNKTIADWEAVFATHASGARGSMVTTRSSRIRKSRPISPYLSLTIRRLDTCALSPTRSVTTEWFLEFAACHRPSASIPAR
jgi:crotonobetainyl-CoA:carnitine CoA-transferase CaiB-like acyl-CoA transferase